jgi:hypothetical protein
VSAGNKKIEMFYRFLFLQCLQRAQHTARLSISGVALRLSQTRTWRRVEVGVAHLHEHHD